MYQELVGLGGQQNKGFILYKTQISVVQLDKRFLGKPLQGVSREITQKKFWEEWM